MPVLQPVIWNRETSSTTDVPKEPPEHKTEAVASVERGIIRECFIGRATLREGTEDGPRRYVAKVQEIETVNRNGRVYPSPVLEREIGRMKAEINRRPGAVDHPEGFSAGLRTLALKWTNLWTEGKDVWGEFEIVPTDAGRDLQVLIDSGLEIGISSRGYGSAKLEKRGGQEVMVIQPDFQLVTFDAVSDPSVWSARVTVESIDTEHINPAELDDTALAVVARRVQEYMMKTQTPNPPAAVAQEANPAPPEQTVEDGHETVVRAVPAGETPPAEDADTGAGAGAGAAAATAAATNGNAPAQVAASAGDTATTGGSTPGGEAATGSEPALTEALERNEELTARNEQLTARNKDVLAALTAISNLIQDELDEGDFWDVTTLANIASTLQWFDRDEPTDADEAAEHPSLDPLVEVVTRVVRAVSKQSVSDYIESVTSGDKHAAKIAEHLRKHCATKVEVDSRLAEARQLISSLFESEEPVGKGVVTDASPHVVNVPSRRAQENAELARKGRIALPA